MASSSKLVASLPQLAVVLIAGSIAVAFQSVSSWSTSAGALLELLGQPVSISKGHCLALALAAGMYILYTLRSNKQKVFVLDFAVHNPHPR
jgi:hypothetical protein